MVVISIFKFVLFCTGSFVVAMVAKLSGMSHEEIHHYLYSHIEYFTCTVSAVGTVIATGIPTTEYSNVVSAEQAFWGLLRVAGAVIITFFLTRFLKKQFPDDKKTENDES